MNWKYVFTYKFNKIFDYIGGNNMKTIKKIVITGGPCSGKSTMLNLIENTFKEKGYKVLIVSETATELIRVYFFFIYIFIFQ